MKQSYYLLYVLVRNSRAHFIKDRQIDTIPAGHKKAEKRAIVMDSVRDERSRAERTHTSGRKTTLTVATDTLVVNRGRSQSRGLIAE